MHSEYLANCPFEVDTAANCRRFVRSLWIETRLCHIGDTGNHEIDRRTCALPAMPIRSNLPENNRSFSRDRSDLVMNSLSFGTSKQSKAHHN